jgi:hypothetical protein
MAALLDFHDRRVEELECAWSCWPDRADRFTDSGTLRLPSHGSASGTDLDLPGSAVPFAVMRGSSQHPTSFDCRISTF